MAKYKWNTPADWLDDALENMDLENLLSYARDMASRLDNDDIQDLFQADMSADGYFEQDED